MTSSIYAAMSKMTETMLNLFGQEVTISYTTTGIYNTSTGSSSVSTVNQTGFGALFEHKSENIDGILVKVGDKQVLLSPIDITEPKVNDIVIVNGVSYSIIQVMVINPAGIVCLYELNVRGL